MAQVSERSLRVRVAYKSNLWRKRNGSKLLMLHLMLPSGAIVRTSAEDEIAMLFDKIIEYNEVYDICDSITNFMLGIHLSYITYLSRCVNGAGDFPPIRYDYLPIKVIQGINTYNVVDCKAICRVVGSLKTITTAEGTTYNIRKLYLVDDSKAVIALKLWDEYACNFNHVAPFVIDVQRAIVTRYKFENFLNVSNSIPPAISSSSTEQCSDFEWLDSMLSSSSAGPAAGGYFKIQSVIHDINFTNFRYKACNLCQEKLIKCSTDGKYYCDECRVESSDFQYQLMLKMFIGEPKLEVVCYHEVVENLIDRSADDVLHALENNPSEAEEIFKPIYKKMYMFYVRIEQGPSEDEMEPNNIVLSAYKY